MFNLFQSFFFRIDLWQKPQGPILIRTITNWSSLTTGGNQYSTHCLTSQTGNSLIKATETQWQIDKSLILQKINSCCTPNSKWHYLLQKAVKYKRNTDALVRNAMYKMIIVTHVNLVGRICKQESNSDWNFLLFLFSMYASRLRFAEKQEKAICLAKTS